MSPLVVSHMGIQSRTELITINTTVTRKTGTVLGLHMTDHVDFVYRFKPTVKTETGKSVLNRIFEDQGLYRLFPL